MKTRIALGTAGLVLVSALGAACAQSDTPPPARTGASVAGTAGDQTPSDGTYATGKPLEQQSREGFWGHMNPFARKKWVHRQVDPIKDRANELDQLQSKNAKDIRDVDTRATSGIARANAAAHDADAHAGDAANRADTANSLAVSADGKTTALHGTVANLDQYSEVRALAIPFVAGRTALGPKAKESLDTVAAALGSQKGYIVEVQGYSRAGVANSQAMADSVVRYLVTAHQVPIYRIYRTGLGKQVSGSDASTQALTNGVRVKILQNSLATMSTPTGTSQGVSKPPANN